MTLKHWQIDEVQFWCQMIQQETRTKWVQYQFKHHTDAVWNDISDLLYVVLKACLQENFNFWDFECWCFSYRNSLKDYFYVFQGDYRFSWQKCIEYYITKIAGLPADANLWRVKAGKQFAATGAKVMQDGALAELCTNKCGGWVEWNL